MAARSNPIYRALNRPLTILGAERKLFFVAVTMAAAVFNMLDNLLGGLAGPDHTNPGRALSLRTDGIKGEEINTTAWQRKPLPRRLSGCAGRRASSSPPALRHL